MTTSLSGRTKEFAEETASTSGLHLDGLLEWLQSNGGLDSGWDPGFAVYQEGCTLLAGVDALPEPADYP